MVARDFGFAPNPFHGYCTLATCKPEIRRKAQVNDWVIGMGGTRLNATGRCIFAMQITGKITFNEYWTNPAFLDKKPVRNGSRKMMVGDNIYHKVTDDKWYQADSHHSNPDGSFNLHNLEKDTKSDSVLLSRHFFYFGTEAQVVPSELLNAIKYKNGRNYRKFNSETEARLIIEWLHNSFLESLNQVISDPFDFNDSEKRYSGINDKIA